MFLVVLGLVLIRLNIQSERYIIFPYVYMNQLKTIFFYLMDRSKQGKSDQLPRTNRTKEETSTENDRVDGHGNVNHVGHDRISERGHGPS